MLAETLWIEKVSPYLDYEQCQSRWTITLLKVGVQKINSPVRDTAWSTWEWESYEMLRIGLCCPEIGHLAVTLSAIVMWCSGPCIDSVSVTLTNTVSSHKPFVVWGKWPTPTGEDTLSTWLVGPVLQLIISAGLWCAVQKFSHFVPTPLNPTFAS